jgi:hypothetical protein
MENKRKIEEEIELTLNSLDMIPEMKENPFLAEKIIQGIKENKYRTGRINKIILNPVFLSVVFILNVITGVYYFETQGTSVKKEKKLIEYINKEYGLGQKDYSSWNGITQ